MRRGRGLPAGNQGAPGRRPACEVAARIRGALEQRRKEGVQRDRNPDPREARERAHRHRGRRPRRGGPGAGGGVPGLLARQRLPAQFPARLTRLDYRVNEWDPAFRAYLRRLESKGKPAVFCGDLNVAHTEMDLAGPKPNRRNAGFTDEERESFGRLLDRGFVDTFREFEKGPGHYTWWSQLGDCRAKNIGWRVDYFVASARLLPALRRAWISPEVMGSDHCPVGLELG